MGLLRLLILLYVLAIIGVIILSWFPMEYDSPVAKLHLFLRRITEPVLAPVRRVIPPINGRIDLSPTIVLFVLLTLLQIF